MPTAKNPRVWIVDGHNLIFQVPHLKDLQASGRRTEARRELEHLLRAFAAEHQEEVVIVYDGDSHQGNPDTLQEPLLRTTYSLGSPEEVADDRILYLAREYRSQQHKVSVVTSDVRTLAIDLDSAVAHVAVGEFWRRHIERAPPGGDKAVTGDYSDIEAEFLRRDHEASRQPPPAPGPPPSAHKQPPPSAPRKPPPARPRTISPGPEDNAAGREQLRLKKERGRLRQQRRLKGRRKKK